MMVLHNIQAWVLWVSAQSPHDTHPLELPDWQLVQCLRRTAHNYAGCICCNGTRSMLESNPQRNPCNQQKD